MWPRRLTLSLSLAPLRLTRCLRAWLRAALARRSEVFASPKAHSLPREASLQAREAAAAKNGEER